MLRKISLSVLLVLFVFTGMVLALDYSADIVNKVKGRTYNSKIYFSKEKIRNEMTQAGHSMISIIRLDKKVMYSIMPEQKMYMQMAMQPEKTLGMTDKVPGQVDRKKVGRENVNGVGCDKYLATYVNKATGVKDSVYLWLSADNIPMRTADLKGTYLMEIKNLKKGPQPNSLFEVPAGYRKQAMPMMPSKAVTPMKGKMPMDYQKMLDQVKQMH